MGPLYDGLDLRGNNNNSDRNAPMSELGQRGAPAESDTKYKIGFLVSQEDSSRYCLFEKIGPTAFHLPPSVSVLNSDADSNSDSDASSEPDPQQNAAPSYEARQKLKRGAESPEAKPAQAADAVKSKRPKVYKPHVNTMIKWYAALCAYLLWQNTRLPSLHIARIALDVLFKLYDRKKSLTDQEMVASYRMITQEQEGVPTSATLMGWVNATNIPNEQAARSREAVSGLATAFNSIVMPRRQLSSCSQGSLAAQLQKLPRPPRPI